MAWSAAASAMAAAAILLAVTAMSGQVRGAAAPPSVTDIALVPPVYNWTATVDPPSKPYYMAAPVDESSRVYRCWGYLARGKATAEMRSYLLNKTLPSSNTCDGVNRVHPTCWPRMFTAVFQQVTLRELHRLRKFCRANGSLPAADHFDFA